MVQDFNTKCTRQLTVHTERQITDGKRFIRNVQKQLEKDTNEECTYCDDTDTVELTILSCTRWDRIRVEAENKLAGEVTPGDTTVTMTRSIANCKFCIM